jgi:competence protein ComEC
LAISGLHVGMLILVLMLILYPLGKRLSYSIISAILTIYPIFTGLQPPVLRASLMGILVLIGKIKNFQINSLNILFFVGTLIIIVSPDMLFSPSFQLSFVAVLGIILGLNMFNFTGNSIWELIAGALWVSIVAMLFTSPIVMYYFGQLSPISIIATPIATIPLYPYIFLSVLNIISAFSFDILVDLMNKFGTIFLTISVFFSDLNIYFIGFAPKLFYVIIYILVLIILFIWDKNKLLRLGLIAISTVIFLALSYTKQTKEFEVYKIRRGYVVKFNQNKCLIYQSKYNPFVVNKLNKINCQERIFVFNPRKKEDIPSGFDKYVPLNQEFYGIKFLKVGRKILIKINDKFINKSQIKVLE